jgi:PKD repeat protein
MRSPTVAQLAVVVLAVALLGTVPSAQGAGEPGVVHFTAAGDYGSGADATAVLDGIAAAEPDLALNLGDFSYGEPGGEQQWCDYVTSRLGAGFPFELLAGDNESGGQDGHVNNFSACLPNQLPGLVGTYGRQWYVDVPQVDPLVRFVMISPALPFPDGTWTYPAGSARYDWTAAAIDGARAKGVPWVVVGSHVPCVSLGPTCAIGGDLLNLLLTKRVDLVLHGHEHLYGRTHQLGLRAGCAVVHGSYDTDCVLDADAEMSQGGTVQAIVGTGGRSLTSVGTSDAEYPYFAAVAHANRTPAYGFLDVRVTADELRAQFVRTSTGTFTDAFTIRRGPPPPNQEPTAAFTSSSQGLTASFDASGSGDPDGPLTAYEWDFGDGGTGSGVQPQHAFTAEGSYDVTLTVRDTQGATATVSHPVSVTAPQAGAEFVADAFGRTVSNGLGAADIGGPWSTAGTTADFDVSPGAAAIALPRAGQTRSCWLGATTSADTDLLLTLSLDKRPTGSGAYLDVVGRRVAQNLEYRARLVLAANGRITVALTALRGSSSAVTIASGVQLPASITYAAGSQLHVRMQVVGTGPTTVRLKVWPAGTPEPTGWQRTATDAFAALQAPGGVGLTTYLSGSVTNGPVVVRLSALTARPT